MTTLSAAMVGLSTTPANADITTPNGVTVHARADCIAEISTVNLQVRPDPENASIRLGLRDRASGADYGYTPFVSGVAYADWREYTFGGIQLPGEPVGEIRYTDVEVRVHYAWIDDGGTYWDVEETLPDPCLI